MASIDNVLLMALYIERKMSIPEISLATGVPRSNIRYALKKLGVLRSIKESLAIASASGKLGIHHRGKKRIFTDEWKMNISLAQRKRADKYAKGITLKPNGYLEHTRGVHKFRSVHVVVMEEMIGRRLLQDEVVHHIDGIRTNNDPGNLQLMSRSEHARIHALENYQYRERKQNGQFK